MCVSACRNFEEIKISFGPGNQKGMLSMLLSWKAAARPEHLSWRPNRGRWACMVPAEAVTAHVTAAAPAIAPGTPHMREKASSLPAFVTSPHPPASTTTVNEHEKRAYMDVVLEVQSSWHLLLRTADRVCQLIAHTWVILLLVLAVRGTSSIKLPDVFWLSQLVVYCLDARDTCWVRPFHSDGLSGFIWALGPCILNTELCCSSIQRTSKWSCKTEAHVNS